MTRRCPINGLTTYWRIKVCHVRTPLTVSAIIVYIYVRQKYVYTFKLTFETEKMKSKSKVHGVAALPFSFANFPHTESNFLKRNISNHT